MTFEFSLSMVKQDLAALMGGLEALKRDLQKKGILNYKLLSSLPSSSHVTNIYNDAEKINLSSEKIANLISMGEVEIQSMPDYETKIKQDSNYFFSILVSKAIDNLFEFYQQEFNKMQDKEREQFIQDQIEKEKSDNEKLQRQLEALQTIEDEKLKQELFIRMAILQAMKLHYAELSQRETGLTFQLKQNLSELIGKNFVSPEGKPLLTKEQQEYIADKIVDYKIKKFFEIREAFSKNPAYQQAQRYAPGNFVPANKKDLNAAVFSSMRWQAVNQTGVIDVIKSACSELQVEIDKTVIEENAKIIAEASENALEVGLREIAFYREISNNLRDSYEEEVEKIQSLNDELGLDLENDFTIDGFSDDEASIGMGRG